MGVEMKFGTNDVVAEIIGRGKIIKQVSPIKRIDWEAIERQFVQTESRPTIKGLCRELKINPSTMYIKANEDGWWEKRESYWKAIHESVGKEIYQRTIRRSISRVTKIANSIDKVIKDLSTDKKISEASVSDLEKLLKIEQRLLTEVPGQPAHDRERADTIVEIQVARLRAITGERGANLENLINAGLRRLGLIEGKTPSDGPPPERQGVRVRPPPPQEREG